MLVQQATQARLQLEYLKLSPVVTPVLRVMPVLAVLVARAVAAHRAVVVFLILQHHTAMAVVAVAALALIHNRLSTTQMGIVFPVRVVGAQAIQTMVPPVVILRLTPLVALCQQEPTQREVLEEHLVEGKVEMGMAIIQAQIIQQSIEKMAKQQILLVRVAAEVRGLWLIITVPLAHQAVVVVGLLAALGVLAVVEALDLPLRTTVWL